MVKMKVVLEAQVKYRLILKVMIKVWNKVKENIKVNVRINFKVNVQKEVGVKWMNYLEVKVKTLDCLSLI